MVFAAVDVGSNTLRLLVAEVKDGSLKPLRYERVITRLAKGIRDTGLLDEAAAKKSIEVLKKFDGIIQDSGTSRTRCVGTSALREARNSATFLGMAREGSGMEIDLVSGEEEATLTARGVFSSIRKPESYVIVDIGGGSTELIYSTGKDTVGHMTEPVGVVKMTEAYMRSDPPSEEELAAIRADADLLSRKVIERVPGHTVENGKLIGTAGTASTLAAMDLGLERFDPRKVHKHKIGIEKLDRMFSTLKSLPVAERGGIRGLEPQRADLIIPGIIITISLMECLGFTSILISNDGLLEGIVLEIAREGLKSEY
jgi:exopolyphosphatase/guanosine-5'-triphosphate,3'-diphosphate pyrophosphatase